MQAGCQVPKMQSCDHERRISELRIQVISTFFGVPHNLKQSLSNKSLNEDYLYLPSVATHIPYKLRNIQTCVRSLRFLDLPSYVREKKDEISDMLKCCFNIPRKQTGQYLHFVLKEENGTHTIYDINILILHKTSETAHSGFFFDGYINWALICKCFWQDGHCDFCLLCT